MNTVVPHRFLFRSSLPVVHVPGLPKSGSRLLDLPPTCILPDFSELDGATTFGEIRAAWNAHGLGFAVDVRGKSRPPLGNSAAPAESDGLQVWIDTRNTQTIHRASRFCHHFCAAPTGSGKRENAPFAAQRPIARAREEGPLAKPEQMQVWSALRPDGYSLELWLPGEILYGFEPESNPLLGFYYWLHDRELGDQFQSVGLEFPFSHDPSLWSTLELTS